MGVERKDGLTFIKSRNYVVLRFLELEFCLAKRIAVFVDQPMSDGKYVLIIKDKN